jgi:uncharacterized protein (DUF486 family)
LVVVQTLTSLAQSLPPICDLGNILTDFLVPHEGNLLVFAWYSAVGSSSNPHVVGLVVVQILMSLAKSLPPIYDLVNILTDFLVPHEGNLLVFAWYSAVGSSSNPHVVGLVLVQTPMSLAKSLSPIYDLRNILTDFLVPHEGILLVFAWYSAVGSSSNPHIVGSVTTWFSEHPQQGGPISWYRMGATFLSSHGI